MLHMHASLMKILSDAKRPPSIRTEAIEERTLVIPEGKDVEVALDAFKRHFKRAGGERSEAQRETQKQVPHGTVGR